MINKETKDYLFSFLSDEEKKEYEELRKITRTLMISLSESMIEEGNKGETKSSKGIELLGSMINKFATKHIKLSEVAIQFTIEELSLIDDMLALWNKYFIHIHLGIQGSLANRIAESTRNN